MTTDNTRLGKELAKLEAEDPAVAAAARKYDEMVDRILGDVRAGGYEPEIHACDGHRWQAEDRRPPNLPAERGATGEYEMYVCEKCRAVQCDRSDNGERCREHRHHRGYHVFPSGRLILVGA